MYAVSGVQSGFYMPCILVSMTPCFCSMCVCVCVCVRERERERERERVYVRSSFEFVNVCVFRVAVALCVGECVFCVYLRVVCLPDTFVFSTFEVAITGRV